MPNRFGVSLTARGNGAAQSSGQHVVARRPRTAPRTPATQQRGIPAFLEQDLEDYLQRLDSQQLADGKPLTLCILTHCVSISRCLCVSYCALSLALSLSHSGSIPNNSLMVSTHWGALDAHSAHSVCLHLTLPVSLAVRDCVSHWASLSHCLTAARFKLLRLKADTVGHMLCALTRCASFSHCLCVPHSVL